MTSDQSFRRLVAVALLALWAGQAGAHEGEDHGPAPVAPMPGGEGVAVQRLADGGLFVPKATQRLLGLRTVPARLEALADTLVFNGTVIADPDASGRVQAVQSGRLETGPRGLPTLGRRVAKGEVLAWLRPTASSLERGNQQALLAELEARSAIAERRAGRLEQLEGAVPHKEIEAARLELDGLRKRRAAIGASLAEPEALRAPVAGVISAAHAVAGQVVEAREVLFEIIDPARLAVEALAYDPLPAGSLAEPVAQVAGGSVGLRFIGAGGQLRGQAMPLLFRVRSATMGLAVGQPVKVIARTATRTRGVAVPRAALVKNAAGDTVVWLHTGAERFAPRVVKASPLGADSMAVTSGLADGDRVVTAGASLLAQMR